MSALTTVAKTEEPTHLDDLRAAIRANKVNFPVPVPIFARQHRPEIQWRLAELYFVHGWSPGRLAERYHITKSRVRQALRAWVQGARAFGYLQRVAPEQEARFEIARAAHASQSLFQPTVVPDHFTSPLPAAPQRLHNHA